MSTEKYLSGIEATDAKVRQYFREIGLPEVVAEWARAIPANTTRSLSPSQWDQIGPYPPALRDLINVRCGLLRDDYLEPKGEDRPSYFDVMRCANSITDPIACKAQIGYD